METDKYHATCETDSEGDVDSGVNVDEAFRRSPASANVAAKRSKSSDLNAQKAAEATKDKLPANIDLQSDSGYSSHTAATMSSADSAPSAKSQSPPVAPANAASVPPPSPSVKRRPIVSDNGKQEMPRKPLGRSGSVSSRKPRGERRLTNAAAEEDCTDPNCTQCRPSTARSRQHRPDPSPLQSAAGSFVSSSRDQAFRRPDPTVPQSPSYARQSNSYLQGYNQGSVVVQPATSHRRSSSSNRGMRPVSYHGDPGQTYWVPGMPAPYPSPPQDHGPPPSMSAHYAMNRPPQPLPYGLTGATPPNPGVFYAMNSLQTSPPYEAPPQTRPSMPSRNSSNFSTRRPTSQYIPTLVTYDQPASAGKGPSARYPDAPQSARFAPSTSNFDLGSSEDESSEDEYDYEYEVRARDRVLMLPPALKGKRRQSLITQSQTLPERPKERDSRASRVSTTPSSRAPSKPRPTLVQQPKAQTSYDLSNRDAKVLVERSFRRQSYQGYEQPPELERKHRNSKMYDPEPVVSTSRRHHPATDARRRGEDITDAMKDVEAYQSRTRGSEDPLTEKVHRAAKRASRVVSGPSEAESSRSKNSDKASRVSHSNRTAITNSGSGEIRVRIDASAPLSLHLNGDMDGRTLQFNPAEDGMAELVIGNARGSENSYRSEKGSVTSSNKRLIANNARRDAEETSVRSSRSSQTRRERGDDRERRHRRRVDQEYA